MIREPISDGIAASWTPPLHPLLFGSSLQGYGEPHAALMRQFAAGAKSVAPVHELGVMHSNWPDARAAIEKLPMKPLPARVASAHVMGGCAMGANPKHAVVNAYGAHHQIENLSVFDSPVFPTSLGANPQLSIYGFSAPHSSRLAEQLTGRPAPLIA